MTWNDVAKIIVTLLLSGTVGIVFKIIYDWLKQEKSHVVVCPQNDEHVRRFIAIEKRLGDGATKFATLEEIIKDLSKRVDDHDYVKTSVIKTEILLSELSKNVGKMENYLEKNLDEVFVRLRDVEDKVKDK